MLLTFIYSKRQKPMYRAIATFLVTGPGQLKSEGLSLDSILRNNPRFLEAHALNRKLLDPLLKESFDVPEVDAPLSLLDYLGIDDGSLEDRLYFGRLALARSVDVSVPDQQFPFLLSVSVSLNSPKMASQIANSVVERIVQADLALQTRRARERTSFINSLVKNVGVDLRAAEEKLTM